MATQHFPKFKLFQLGEFRAERKKLKARQVKQWRKFKRLAEADLDNSIVENERNDYAKIAS